MIGFGQGATLASIIVAKHPEVFTYLIAISAFKARSLAHQHLFAETNPLKTASLHVYGKHDILITPSRSLELSKCFLNGQTCEHLGGHFAPNSWPVAQMAGFIKDQAENVKTPQAFMCNQSLGVCAHKLELALIRYELDALDLTPLFGSEWARELLKCDAYRNYFERPPQHSLQSLTIELEKAPNDHVDDRFLILYVLLIRAKAADGDESETKAYTYSVLSLFLDVYVREDEARRDYIHDYVIPMIFVNVNKWRELILLCDLCYRQADEIEDEKQKETLSQLYSRLIKLFANQLVTDLAAVDRESSSFLVQSLTSVKLAGR